MSPTGRISQAGPALQQLIDRTPEVRKIMEALYPSDKPKVRYLGFYKKWYITGLPYRYRFLQQFLFSTCGEACDIVRGLR